MSVLGAFPGQYMYLYWLYVDEANHLSVADATLKVIELQSTPTVVAIGFSRPSS